MHLTVKTTEIHLSLCLQVAQGLIWVWGENGVDAGLESAVTPAPLVPELDDTEGIESGRIDTGSIYQRDLPYSWETFMENVLVSLHWDRTIAEAFWAAAGAVHCIRGIRAA